MLPVMTNVIDDVLSLGQIRLQQNVGVLFAKQIIFIQQTVRGRETVIGAITKVQTVWRPCCRLV